MLSVNDIPETQLTYIKQHLTECSPQEGCGLLIRLAESLEYWPVVNSSGDKMNSFRIAPQDYAEAEEAGEVVAIIHSHPGEDGIAYPSILDRQLMRETCLPWIIYAPQKDEIAVFFEEPVGLLGREFVLGATDCYGLVMAWHRSRGIFLPDFRRPYPWWERGRISLQMRTSRPLASSKGGGGAGRHGGVPHRVKSNQPLRDLCRRRDDYSPPHEREVIARQDVWNLP